MAETERSWQKQPNFVPASMCAQETEILTLKVQVCSDGNKRLQTPSKAQKKTSWEI